MFMKMKALHRAIMTRGKWTKDEIQNVTYYRNGVLIVSINNLDIFDDLQKLKNIIEIESRNQDITYHSLHLDI